VSSATRTWAYDFTAASNFEGTIPVTATDRATNAGTASFTLVRDGTPPAVAVTATVEAEDIHVTWEASDTGSDLNTCSLEVDTGDGSPEELSTSCAGKRIYTEAEPGQTCIFRLSATDNVGNQASAEAISALPRVTKYFYHGGRRVAMRSGGQVYYLHGDHLGSVSLVTDESGEVVSRQLYHPFGTVRYTEGANPTDFGFTGQKAVPGTGLLFYHARYYHPALGRFISPDSIVPGAANPQAWNRYSYCLNNPLVYTDPTGNQPSSPSDWFWFAIGAAGQFSNDMLLGAPYLISDVLYGPGWEMNWPDAGREGMVAGRYLSQAVAAYIAGQGAAKLGAGLAAIIATIIAGVAIPAEVALALEGTLELGYAGLVFAVAAKNPIHHIATNKNRISDRTGGPWTPRFEELFAKGGMTLEDAANKIPLPGHGKRAPHSQGYHQWVYKRLQDAIKGVEGEEAIGAALEAELDAIRQDLLANPDLLRH
jgi:RHS repeat-associated protein